MDITDLITLINQSGFPIVVALYSLIRLETTIKHNTDAIASMSSVVQLLAQKEKGDDK